MGHPDINDKILIQQSNADRNLYYLLRKTEQRIAEILIVNDGQFRIEKSALPDGYFEPDIPIEPVEPPTSEDEINSEISHELIENEEKGNDTDVKGLPEEEILYPQYSYPEADTSRSFLPRPSAALPTPVLDPTFPSRDHPAGEENHVDKPVNQYDIDGTSPKKPRAEAEVGIEPYVQADHELPRNGSSITEYELSDFETVFTPSVSAASDMTTTPRLDFETRDITDTTAEMNRSMIRNEVNLILGTFFGGLAEQMKGNSLGG